MPKILPYEWSYITLYIGEKYDVTMDTGTLTIPFDFVDNELFQFLKVQDFFALSNNGEKYHKSKKNIKTRPLVSFTSLSRLPINIKK